MLRELQSLTSKNKSAHESVFRLMTMLTVALLTGCTTTASVDLAKQRQNNLQADMALLDKEKAPMPKGALTLDQAIAYSLQNNLAVRSAQFEQAVASDQAAAERLNMLPNLTAGASQNYRSSLPTQDYIQPDGTVVQANSIGSFKDSLTADLQLTWSVLDFGVSYYRARQAGWNERAVEIRRQRQAQLLALDVTKAYWRAAMAEDALDYTRAVEQELKRQKSMIDRSVQQRRIDPIAAKDASKRLVDLLLTIRDLQAEVSSSRLELAKLMGLRQRTDFRLAREAIRPVLARMPRPKSMDVRAMEQYALNNRPELFEADLNERISQDDARAEFLSVFPDLTFGLGGHYDDNRLLHSNEWASAGASLSWNLLKIPAVLARTDAKESRTEQVKRERMKTTLGVMTQVNLSLLDYAVMVDRFLLLEESYGLTHELLGMVREHNRVGKISDLAVTQRLLEDVAAKLRRDRAVVDIMVSYRRVLASLGLDVAEWNGDLRGHKLVKAGATSAKLDLNFTESAHVKPAPAPVKPTVAPVAYEQFVLEDVPTAEPIRIESQSSRPVVIESDINDLVSAYGRPSERDRTQFPFVLQVGAYTRRSAIDKQLSEARALVPQLLDDNDPVVTTTSRDGRRIYRARYHGFAKGEAQRTCQVLKNKGMDCWVDIKR